MVKFAKLSIGKYIFVREAEEPTIAKALIKEHYLRPEDKKTIRYKDLGIEITDENTELVKKYVEALKRDFKSVWLESSYGKTWIVIRIWEVVRNGGNN